MDRINEAIEAMGTLKLDKSMVLVYGEDIDLAIEFCFHCGQKLDWD